jgi:hypothetical protein
MNPTQTLAAGLVDDVHDSQQAFRQVLNALARPGQVCAIGPALPGVALGGAMARLLLSLSDDETAVWWSCADPQLPQWLRFHTGATVAERPEAASFGVFTVMESFPPPCSWSCPGCRAARRWSGAAPVLPTCSALGCKACPPISGRSGKPTTPPFRRAWTSSLPVAIIAWVCPAPRGCVVWKESDMSVAVKGGAAAIESSWRLLEVQRRGDTAIAALSVAQIRAQLSLAVDRVMSEGSLYDPELAALAIKQASGDLVEAIFLLRAYRTTLPRLGYALPLETARIALVRRISATFKEVPGGQLLGPTYDYTPSACSTSLCWPRRAPARPRPQPRPQPPASHRTAHPLLPPQALRHVRPHRRSRRPPCRASTTCWRAKACWRPRTHRTVPHG